MAEKVSTKEIERLQKQKVSTKEIERLQKQKVEKNEFVDSVDAVDRGTGRILSTLGKWIKEGF